MIKIGKVKIKKRWRDVYLYSLNQELSKLALGIDIDEKCSPFWESTKKSPKTNFNLSSWLTSQNGKQGIRYLLNSINDFFDFNLTVNKDKLLVITALVML